MTLYSSLFILTTPLFWLAMYLPLVAFLGEPIQKNIKYFSGYVAFSVISYMMMECTAPPILNLVNLYFWLSFIGLYHPHSATRRFSVSFIIILIHLTSETVTCALFDYLTLDFFSINSFDSPVLLVLIRVTTMVAVCLIYKFMHTKKNDFSISGFYYLLHLYLLICLLYLYIQSLDGKELVSINVLINSAVLVSIVVVSVLAEKKIHDSIMVHSEKKLLEEQNLSFLNQKEVIDQSTAIVSSVKHDMKNHIFSLMLLLEEPESAKIYAKNLLDSIDDSSLLCSSKNFIIDSIVNFKLQNLEEQGVNLTVDVFAPKELNMLAYDLTIILANILDNAVTATLEGEKNRFISLRINYNKNYLIIALRNSYSGVLNIQNGELKSTKQAKTNHGIGIKNVKQAVERYGGILDIQYDDTFQVAISIPLLPN